MTVQEVTTEHGFSYLECDCSRKAVRQRTQRNGVLIYAEQCLDCGRFIRAISKRAPEIIQMPNRVAFDETLQEKWRQRQREYSEQRQQARDAARQEQNAEWWAKYSRYLETNAWRLKRQAVLTRANNWCEGCAMRPAVHVHHTTYEHVFNEFLFELVALCEPCHRRIHPHMQGN